MMKTMQIIDLIAIKVFYNLKAEVAQTYLSYIWWILEPAMYMAMFYVIFGVMLQQENQGFVFFLLTGLVPWLWFAKSITNSSMSIVHSSTLVQQVAISKSFFPTIVIFQDFVKQLLVLSLLLVLLAVSGFISVTWLYLPVVVLVQLLFTWAVALWVAMLIPFAEDLRYIVATGLQLLMFASGIFYSTEDVVMPEYQFIFMLNPIANLIEQYRSLLIEAQTPDMISLLLITLVSTGAMWIAQIIYFRVDYRYPRIVLE